MFAIFIGEQFKENESTLQTEVNVSFEPVKSVVNNIINSLLTIQPN